MFVKQKLQKKKLERIDEAAAKNDQIIGEIDSMIGDVQTPQDSFGGDAVGGMRR